jgi:hypothetical protein
MLNWMNWSRKRMPPQTGWSANAYMTGDRLVIHSCSRTYNNRGWCNQPVYRLPVQSDTSDIGSQLRAALDASVWDSRMDDSQLSPHPVAVEAGFTSWDDLEKNSRLVIIETDKRLISMTPCRAAKRNEGRGFVGLDQEKVQTDGIQVTWRLVVPC